MNLGRYIIGADVGGSHILCGAVELASGELLKETLVEEKIDNKASQDVILQSWAKTLNDTISKVNLDQVVGLGFAMPGAFNYKTGVALFEGNEKYESLYKCDVPLNLAPLLAAKGLKMRFLNDASSFAVGEAWRGKAADVNRSISITLGTGFGSAFIQGGIPVTEGSLVPKHGSLWHLPFKTGIADDYFSTRWFTSSYYKLTGRFISGVKEAFELTFEKDQVAIQLFHQFGVNMAIFMADWIRKFDPQVIVLGGNISKAWDLFSAPFFEQMSKESLSIKVEISELKESAAILGASRLFEDTFWQHIQPVLTEF